MNLSMATSAMRTTLGHTEARSVLQIRAQAICRQLSGKSALPYVSTAPPEVEPSPLFARVPGDRLTTTRRSAHSSPALSTAGRIRSRESWSPAPGRPVSVRTGVPADVRLDDDRMTADPDDGDAGHLSRTYMKLLGILRGVNEWLRIRPAGVEDADPIARLFLASKATLTFLPNVHTDEETFYFIQHRPARPGRARR
jgi:hypothetical protein